jgi:hypothetical protein
LQSSQSKINIDLSALNTEDVGLNVDKGLATGIETHTPVVLEAVTEMVSETIKTTKKGFQIQSPSKVIQSQAQQSPSLANTGSGGEYNL